MAGRLKKLTPEQAAECVCMYDAGLSLAPIASYFGVSRQSMWDLLRRRTKMRPQQREGKDNHFHRGGETADDQAHNIVEKAVKRGIIRRPAACEACGGASLFADGRAAIQAHHDDYNRPLSVRWLCQPCHHEWHKNNRAIPVKEEAEAPRADIACAGFP